MWVWWRRYCLVGLLIVCWFGFGLLVGWLLVAWLLVSWFVDCLLVFCLLVGLSVGWFVGWVFDCLLGLLIVCFFWLGCCCIIRQAVLEVGLKVQVALWRTWALPASPLRRNTRLTWSPTTSFVCLCLGFVFSFAFVQHCQPAPWEGIGASHKIITNLQMFKPPRMSPREICLLIACSTRWMHVPNLYLSHPLVVEGVLVKQFGTGTILLMNPTNVCTTSRPRPKSQPKLSAKYLVIPAFIHHTTPCQRHKKTITWLFSWLLLLYDRAALLPAYKCWSVWGAN